MAMRRFQLMVDEELDDALEGRAREEGVSKAELLRRFARDRLQRPRSVEDDPIWDMVGADTGPDLVDDDHVGQVSSHKNEVLYGAGRDPR